MEINENENVNLQVISIDGNQITNETLLDINNNAVNSTLTDENAQRKLTRGKKFK